MSNEHLDWNSTIENDSQSFTLLPPGNYAFQVASLEKTTSNTSGAPMAVVTLNVASPMGDVAIKDYLVLTKAAEWKLCSFFRAIGMKKSGEPLVMNCAKVEGKKGRAEIIVDSFTKKEGGKGESNKVKNYLDPDPKAAKANVAPVQDDNPDDEPADALDC
jgi:hypothetical protein